MRDATRKYQTGNEVWCRQSPLGESVRCQLPHGDSFRVACSWPLSANVASFIKPEVWDISQRYRRTIELRPYAASAENLVKFGRVWFQRYARGQTDRRTRRHFHYNTRLHCLRQSKKYRHCPHSMRSHRFEKTFFLFWSRFFTFLTLFIFQAFFYF